MGWGPKVFGQIGEALRKVSRIMPRRYLSFVFEFLLPIFNTPTAPFKIYLL
jgi:hypothetical protein